MKICVYGAGAIGGYVAARLAHAGAEVTVIARGDKLAAIRTHGLKLIQERGDIVTRPAATDDPAEAGPQDYVIVAMKAHAVPAVAARMAPLLGPATAVVPAVNGVPWWYFYRLDGPYRDRRLETVDPGGAQWRHIGPERVIGCVVYPAAEVAAPGVVRHIALDRMPIGEPDGSRSERALRLSEMMILAGMKAPVRARIRDDIWVKLWGNVSFNPVSVLTGATLGEIARDAGTRAVVRAMMVEAQAVGETLGVRFPIGVDARIEGGAEVGDHKTSTLQDLEAGRPLELAPLVGAVAELGDVVGIDTPTIDMIYALARQRAITAGCWPEG
ncbi:MAG TPA: 2-dehydropantoate 2-reductase [Alphaproteobacteria bacterium]